MSIYQSSLGSERRGPYSAWRQTYVGECAAVRPSADEALACEVELVVRDLFESDEVDLEDITMIVCYAVERRDAGEVGVYTIGVVLRGYPINVPEEHLVSWAPSVASLVHRLTFSESLSVRSEVDMLEAYASVKDIFDDDDSAVYVQQFFRAPLSRTIGSRRLWERAPVDSSFRLSRKWVMSEEVESVIVNERKRRVDDDGDRVFKKLKVSSAGKFVEAD
ncbi:hypothetical protein KXX35_009382, partial [Aspergillus fumigatus]